MLSKGFSSPDNSFSLKAFKRSSAHRTAPDRAGERRLLRAARAGDRRALKRLFELVATPALRFGRGFCRHDDDAEDVMQEVLTALARGMDRLRGESSLSTWAYVVARRACVRKRRRSAGAPQRIESLDAGGDAARASREIVDPASDPHHDLERGELREAIRGGLATLPPAHREAVILRDIEGLSAREAAKVLGIGERALKSRLHRGRAALRRALAPHGDGRAAAKPDATHAAERRQPGCPDIATMISRYLEGDLDRSVCDRLQRHVRACPRCTDVCSDLRIALGACRAYGNAPLPPEIRASVKEAIRRTAEGV